MSHIYIYITNIISIHILFARIATGLYFNHPKQPSMTVEENSSRLKLGSLMRSTSSPSMRPMRSWPPKGHDENDWFQKVLASLKAFRCFLEMIPALLCGEPVLLKMHQSQCKYDLSVSQPFHSKVSMAPESWVLNDWHLQFPVSLLPGSRLWPSACQAVTQPAAAWSPQILGIWRMVLVFKCRLAKPPDFRASLQDASGISPSPPRPSPLLVLYHLSPSGWKRPEKTDGKCGVSRQTSKMLGKSRTTMLLTPTVRTSKYDWERKGLDYAKDIKQRCGDWIHSNVEVDSVDCEAASDHLPSSLPTFDFLKFLLFFAKPCITHSPIYNTIYT